MEPISQHLLPCGNKNAESQRQIDEGQANVRCPGSGGASLLEILVAAPLHAAVTPYPTA